MLRDTDNVIAATGNSLTDCRFTVNGPGPDGKFSTYNYVATKSGQQSSNADVGAWRLEVTAPTAVASGAAQHFLHVLSVADNTSAATAPPAMLLASGAGTAAVLLGAPSGTPTLALFNKDVAAAASLEWTSPVARANIIATGLMPETRFALVPADCRAGLVCKLRADSGAGAVYLSSREGVLHIPVE